MAKHPVFPEVPKGFWRRFRKRWGRPLRQFEQTIEFAQSFGADPRAPYFDCMDAEYWGVLRALHSRTCLHARAVLALLADGLVDPAWVQWRVCHEAATIALFIANDPDMAPRYIRHSQVNAYHLAQTLYNTDHHDSPSISELEQLASSADSAKNEHKRDYGQLPKSRDYSWSGFRTFAEIEASVQVNWSWKARSEYVFASEIAHAAPKATRPSTDYRGNAIFAVGPTNAGLTGPADLTCLSLMHASLALMQNATAAEEDTRRLKELIDMRRLVGRICWLSDPAIFCQECGGHVPEASPPEEIPDADKPARCSCNPAYPVH